VAEFIEPVDLYNPELVAWKLDRIVCPDCRELGADRGPCEPEYLIGVYCLANNHLLQQVAAPPSELPPTITNSRYTGGTQKELLDQLVEAIEDWFEIAREVPLWDRFDKRELRIDAVATPRPPLRARFPFESVGIEVAREHHSYAGLTHPLNQCADYVRCTVIGQNSKAAIGHHLDCVALYQGRCVTNRSDPARFDTGILMRAYGRRNVGEFVHEKRHGVSLLVSHERIWCSEDGTSDAKALWPKYRPTGHT
jgi:hypothetical protein